ncbi:ABC transporter substrate-binding protein [Niveibacterium sp. SC-1]|uniref:ABC transporter substrate-binding protein n=1 Tax=Niveibacterium sp. SC-1 TaxID=3135646 RepID=UPI00311EC357
MSKVPAILRKLRLWALLPAFASGALAAADPAVVRIGIASPAPGNPPVFSVGSIGVAREKGWIEQSLAKTNTKVEWYFFKGAGPAVNEAVTNHQLDFVFQGDLPSLVGYGAGLKTRLILPVAVRGNIYLAVPPDSPIHSVKDLRGKRVSIFKGTNSQLPINRLLAANGLTERDIRAINLDTATAQAALSTRDLDAVFGGLELLKLRDKGLARIVYLSRDDAPVFTRQSALLVTDEFVRQYPQTTQRVVTELVRSAQWISDPANHKAVLDVWSRMGTPAAHWEEDYGTDFAPRHSPRFDAFITGRYKEAVADAYTFRLSRKRFDVDGWIDHRFVDTALRELKLENYWPALDAEGKPQKGAHS